ncbi:MAG: sigma-70 family RNA polymerase sigma factor [Salaquimonas sp.]|nr:sigma-70 family RNA polymerase sigma factor [Salaquimonas sp.]
MTGSDFEDSLNALRPKLHRYCARMTGSAIDGEDLLQDTLVKALRARSDGERIDNLEAWLLRIAHNNCLDFLRSKSRRTIVTLTEELEVTPFSDTEIAAFSFRMFAQLPELQRCTVILKDVLGHSIEEISSIAECTPAAAKSALQRGRAALRRLAQLGDDARLPLMSDADRQKIAAYVGHFRNGEFDAIRALLAEEVRLDLVNRLRLEGRDKIGLYFTRYGEETKWRFTLGAVEGQPTMLVYDAQGPMEKPAHFVLIDWQGDRIAAIRDFLFAPYVLEAIDWVRLG